MDQSFNNELISLLESHRDRADVSQCLKLLDEQEARFRDRPPKGIPLKRVLEIYQIRSEINSELNNGIIKGYETLLPALKTANIGSVKIHSIELLAKWYMVFTDEAVSQLFGLLDCPKQIAAWFNHETGYD